jgi:hypothetical protein
VPTPFKRWKATPSATPARVAGGPRGVEEPMHAPNLHAREPGDPAVARLPGSGKGPLREGQGRNPEMNDGGKSDSSVVPAKPPNKAVAAEGVEGRGLTKGNTEKLAGPGLRAGI